MLLSRQSDTVTIVIIKGYVHGLGFVNTLGMDDILRRI